MKKTPIIAVLFSVSILLGCSNPAKDTTATKQGTTDAPKMDSAATMKAYMDYMTPSDIHKLLATYTGEWDGAITMWMAPGSQPSKSHGISNYKMILGGRYQQSEHKGDINGMLTEAVNTLGYDNAKKVFTDTWIDNMGTGTLIMEGPYDPATKTISLKGKMYDPASGKEANMRQTLKLIDSNNQYMELFIEADGKEFKSMEVKYTRKG